MKLILNNTSNFSLTEIAQYRNYDLKDLAGKTEGMSFKGKLLYNVRDCKIKDILTTIYYNRKNSPYQIRKNYYKNDRIILFSHIEIETINRCNNSCTFCPINKNDDDRDFHLMEEGLFKSIIDQLEDLNYNGSIYFHSNNEPLLDDRIYRFIEYAKNKLKNAYLCMYTNGILLTIDNYIKLIKLLNELVIDNYNNKPILIKPIKRIYEYSKNNLVMGNCNLSINLRKIDEVLTSRGGQAKNKEKVNSKFKTCNLPFCQMVVRPTGELSLCCNDCKGKFTLGDLNLFSLEESWNSVEYIEIRERLLKGRKKITLCQYCDTNMKLK